MNTVRADGGNEKQAVRTSPVLGSATMPTAMAEIEVFGANKEITIEGLTLRSSGGSRTIANLDSESTTTILTAERELVHSHTPPDACSWVYVGRNTFRALPLEDAGKLRVERLCDSEAVEQSKRTLRLSPGSVLFTSPGTGDLSRRLAQELGTKPAKVVLEKFPNSETRIEIHESVRDRHAFVVAGMAAPVNEALMETVLLVQALKLADARRITVLLPYFPYSRQDRKADMRPPISARVVTDLLKAVGAHQIVTVDLHATQVEGFFDGPFENLSGLGQLVPSLLTNEGKELVVVSPDAGGSKRAEKFARQLEQSSGNFTPLVVMSKFRPSPAVPPTVTLTTGPEFLTGKTCVLVDDMIDTGGSIIAAARALKERGAARVLVCATHAVFSKDAITRLEHARNDDGKPTIDRIYVTDTLPLNRARSEFLQVVSVAPLVAEAIARLDQPRGTLRELKDRCDLGTLLPRGAGGLQTVH